MTFIDFVDHPSFSNYRLTPDFPMINFNQGNLDLSWKKHLALSSFRFLLKLWNIKVIYDFDIFTKLTLFCTSLWTGKSVFTWTKKTSNLFTTIVFDMKSLKTLRMISKAIRNTTASGFLYPQLLFFQIMHVCKCIFP